MSNSLFKDRLIVARERAGLSQTELGQLCDMAPTQVSRYESGRAVPRRAAMVRLAEALKVPMDWLAFGSDPPEDVLLQLSTESGDDAPMKLVIPAALEPWVGGFAEGRGITLPEAVIEIIRQHQAMAVTAPTGNAKYPIAGQVTVAMTDLDLRIKNLEAQILELLDVLPHESSQGGIISSAVHAAADEKAKSEAPKPGKTYVARADGAVTPFEPPAEQPKAAPPASQGPERLRRQVNRRRPT